MNGNDVIEHIESCEDCQDKSNLIDNVKITSEMLGKDISQKIIDDISTKIELCASEVKE